jgi:hypothetical protein
LETASAKSWKLLRSNPEIETPDPKTE